MSDNTRPDRMERGVRFGCGSLFGVVLGIGVAAQVVEPGWRAALIVVPAVLVCGLLAARWGDKFWDLVFDSFPWFV